MKNFSSTVQAFIAFLSTHPGQMPIFQIDFVNERIIVREASGDFLRKLQSCKIADLQLVDTGLILKNLEI